MSKPFSISGIRTPCYNCERRHIKCHSSCEDYQKSIKDYNNRYSAAEADIINYEKDRGRRIAKRLNKR